MSQACASWRGEIGAYIVGALDQDTGAELRRHLAACGGCRADYADLVPVRDWLGRLTPADGTPAGRQPGGPPLAPIRPVRHRARWRWLAAAGAAAAAVAAIAGITPHPVSPAFGSFDRVTGVHGRARVVGTPTGTEIDLTLTGLPADQSCTLVAVSRAGADVAGTWYSNADGTAQIAGNSAIPVSQLTALRVESDAHRLLLNIPVASGRAGVQLSPPSTR